MLIPAVNMRSLAFISVRENLACVMDMGGNVTPITQYSIADLLSVHTLAYLTATF